MSPWLRCCCRQGAPSKILAISQHCQHCLLVILAHPILAVEVEGVAAEGAAKDVIKLAVKQALREEQDRPGVTHHHLGALVPPCPQCHCQASLRAAWTLGLVPPAASRALNVMNLMNMEHL